MHEHEAYCQPCVSPIWDTGLVCHALLEAGGERAEAEVKRLTQAGFAGSLSFTGTEGSGQALSISS